MTRGEIGYRGSLITRRLGVQVPPGQPFLIMIHLPNVRNTGKNKFFGTTIKTSASKLFDLLGEPTNVHQSNHKSTISWVRELDTADVFIIYDLKYFKELNPEEELIWNIGGQNKQVTEMAKQELLKLLK